MRDSREEKPCAGEAVHRRPCAGEARRGSSRREGRRPQVGCVETESVDARESRESGGGGGRDGGGGGEEGRGMTKTSRERWRSVAYERRSRAQGEGLRAMVKERVGEKGKAKGEGEGEGEGEMGEIPWRQNPKRPTM